LGPFSLGVFSSQSGNFQNALNMLSVVCLILVLMTMGLKYLMKPEFGKK